MKHSPSAHHIPNLIFLFQRLISFLIFFSCHLFIEKVFFLDILSFLLHSNISTCQTTNFQYKLFFSYLCCLLPTTIGTINIKIPNKINHTYNFLHPMNKNQFVWMKKKKTLTILTTLMQTYFSECNVSTVSSNALYDTNIYCFDWIYR